MGVLRFYSSGVSFISYLRPFVRRRWGLLGALLLAMLSTESCTQVATRAISLNDRIPGVDGQPIALVTGYGNDWRWLYIPLYTVDTKKLEAEMLEAASEDENGTMRMTTGMVQTNPLWAIPPYCLVPLPSKTIVLMGVAVKRP